MKPQAFTYAWNVARHKMDFLRFVRSSSASQCYVADSDGPHLPCVGRLTYALRRQTNNNNKKKHAPVSHLGNSSTNVLVFVSSSAVPVVVAFVVVVAGAAVVVLAVLGLGFRVRGMHDALPAE